MTLMNGICGVIAIALSLYLLAALLKPEWFK